MSTLNPYIGFNGRCREAMTFYQQIFGGELNLMEVGGSPMEQMWPSGAKDAIYHAELTGKIIIMGSDMSGPDGAVAGGNISLALGCESEEEINTLFNKLAEGGKIDDTLKKQFWGAMFGAVTDKFGIKWMLNYNIKQ